MCSLKKIKTFLCCHESWSHRLKVLTNTRQQLEIRPSYSRHFNSRLREYQQNAAASARKEFEIERALIFHSRLDMEFEKPKLSKPLLKLKPVGLISRLYSTYQTHNHENTLLEEKTSETLDDIINSIVYSNDDIIVLNKPAGLSVYGSTHCTDSAEKATVNRLLPELQKTLHSPHLEIGLSLKSFYSGLVVLCRETDSRKKLESCLRGSTAQKDRVLTYLVLTVGKPNCLLDRECSAHISRDFLHGREMSVIQEKNNSTARKAGNMMLACFTARTVEVNDDLGVALLEISINKDKWEAVEALLSYHLSPVLGDHVYSSRTMYVMGVPFRATAHSVHPCQQRLPPLLKAALEDFEPTWRDQPGSIPLYMHRHKLELNKFPNKTSKPLILTAPLPKHFVSLLKHLNLYTDNIDVT